MVGECKLDHAGTSFPAAGKEVLQQEKRHKEELAAWEERGNHAGTSKSILFSLALGLSFRTDLRRVSKSL